MLKGKRALITGSTSGIGLAMARALHAEGAEVVLNGFGEADEIAKVTAELNATHHGANLLDQRKRLKGGGRGGGNRTAIT